MYLIQCTIASTGVAQPIIPRAVVPGNSKSFSYFVCQNNASHSIRIGDSTVSTTKGILISPGTPGGSQTITPALQYSGDLTEFYIIGTANDIVDFMILD
jgi:hypothetical protein